ncbi:hypothetical protein BH20ACT15_BH20ACT15_09820 [soil metagenome]
MSGRPAHLALIATLALVVVVLCAAAFSGG